MITQGLSHHEITLITSILDEHGIEYNLDASGGSEAVKLRGGRGDASFYQIEISDEQYEKLPSEAKSKLENLGIYPEMEAPDFIDEGPKLQNQKDVLKNHKTMKKFEKIFIFCMLVMAISFVIRVLRNQ